MVEWVRGTYSYRLLGRIAQAELVEAARLAFALDEQLPVTQCSAHRTSSGVAVLGYWTKEQRRPDA